MEKQGIRFLQRDDEGSENLMMKDQRISFLPGGD